MYSPDHFIGVAVTGLVGSIQVMYHLLGFVFRPTKRVYNACKENITTTCVPTKEWKGSGCYCLSPLHGMIFYN